MDVIIVFNDPSILNTKKTMPPGKPRNMKIGFFSLLPYPSPAGRGKGLGEATIPSPRRGEG